MTKQELGPRVGFPTKFQLFFSQLRFIINQRINKAETSFDALGSDHDQSVSRNRSLFFHTS